MEGLGRLWGGCSPNYIFSSLQRNQQEIIYLNCSSFSCTCVKCNKASDHHSFKTNEDLKLWSGFMNLHPGSSRTFSDVQVGKDRRPWRPNLLRKLSPLQKLCFIRAMRVDCLKAMRLKMNWLCSQQSCAAVFLLCFFLGFKQALYNKGRAGGEKTDFYNGKLLTFAPAFAFSACCSHPKFLASFRNNQSRNSCEKIVSLQNVELYQKELPLAVFVTVIDMVAWLLN